MQWTPGESGEDVEDRRSESGGGGGGGFGGVHLGIGGMIVVGLLSLVFHQNFFALFSGSGGGSSAPMSQSAPRNPVQSQQEDKQVQFVTSALNDVQRTWDQVLPQTGGGSAYRHAKLVLFRDDYPSACGEAQTAIGPFYCPGDEKVYLDLGFFQELSQKFGAPGEFAEAYVIAHEIGHHVQKILGVEQKVQNLRQQNPSASNRLSVGLELQADCFAGVWGHSSQQRNNINADDIKQGMQAAAAVGDDRLQKMATGRVSPESFTHGSSAQRVHWFQQGLESGNPASCNTFSGRQN